MSSRILNQAGLCRVGDEMANGGWDSTQAVAAGVFQINTAVSTFQRLVNTLVPQGYALSLRERATRGCTIDNEIVFNEAIIEEENKEYKRSSNKLGEMISTHIESSLVSTAQKKINSQKSFKTQKSNLSLICLLGDFWCHPAHSDHITAASISLYSPFSVCSIDPTTAP
ncbi:hypothetical protein HPP92_025551 [Vanilla planifolia]|uniref:Uncharacterized protein n=1 Tax=Vanilla planifolia TaxID=51239 RepID=A0A835U914_VANPL|nr:hypothetical protein HPP92_025551 [Vanilla planifolia]